MTEPGHLASRFSLRTVWARNSKTPLRRFLQHEDARVEHGGVAGHPQAPSLRSAARLRALFRAAA